MRLLSEEMPADLAPMRRFARTFVPETEEYRWHPAATMALAFGASGVLWLAIVLPIVWLCGGL